MRLYDFNIEKCKVLPLNAGTKGLIFKLMGKILKIVKRAKYLGITLSRSRLTSLYSKHIEKVLEKAETKTSAMRHLGYHRDGFRPETSVGMYKTLVTPTLEYAAQVLSYKHNYFTNRRSVSVEETPDMIKRLEKFQNRALKKIGVKPKEHTTSSGQDSYRNNGYLLTNRYLKAKVLLETNAFRKRKYSTHSL